MSKQRDYTLPDGTGTNDVKVYTSAVRKTKQNKISRLILLIVLVAVVAGYLLSR